MLPAENIPMMKTIRDGIPAIEKGIHSNKSDPKENPIEGPFVEILGVKDPNGNQSRPTVNLKETQNTIMHVSCSQCKKKPIEQQSLEM